MRVSAYKAGVRVKVSKTFRTTLGNLYEHGMRGTISDISKPVRFGDGWYVHVNYDTKRGVNGAWSPISCLEIRPTKSKATSTGVRSSRRR